jgi:hypothetical protein
MRVEPLDPNTAESGDHIGVQSLGDPNKARHARPFACLAHKPSVLARLIEQDTPRLDRAFYGHGLR